MIAYFISDSGTFFNWSLFEVETSGDYAKDSTYISRTGTLSVNLRDRLAPFSVCMPERKNAE